MKGILTFARQQSTWIAELPRWGEAYQKQVCQDSRAILLVKIDALIQTERGEESRESIQLLREKLPYTATMSRGLKSVLKQKPIYFTCRTPRMMMPWPGKEQTKG